MRNKSL